MFRTEELSETCRVLSPPPKKNWEISASSWFYYKNLHVSESFSVHHKEFFTVHTAMVYVIQVCWQLASRIRTSALILLASFMTYKYTIAVCTVKNSWWWTEELSETCRVLFQKWNWEISASSWFYYKNLSRCTVNWNLMCSLLVTEFIDVRLLHRRRA